MLRRPLTHLFAAPRKLIVARAQLAKRAIADRAGREDRVMQTRRLARRAARTDRQPLRDAITR